MADDSLIENLVFLNRRSRRVQISFERGACLHILCAEKCRLLGYCRVAFGEICYLLAPPIGEEAMIFEGDPSRLRQRRIHRGPRGMHAGEVAIIGLIRSIRCGPAIARRYRRYN